MVVFFGGGRDTQWLMVGMDSFCQICAFSHLLDVMTWLLTLFVCAVVQLKMVESEQRNHSASPNPTTHTSATTGGWVGVYVCVCLCFVCPQEK